MQRFNPGEDVKIVKATITEVDCLGSIATVCRAPMMAPTHVLVRTPNGRYLSLPDSFVQSLSQDGGQDRQRRKT